MMNAQGRRLFLLVSGYVIIYSTCFSPETRHVSGLVSTGWFQNLRKRSNIQNGRQSYCSNWNNCILVRDYWQLSVAASQGKASPSSPRQKDVKRRKNRKSFDGDKRELINTFRKAKSLERVGNFVEAVNLLKICVETDPKDSHSYLALGRITQRLDGTEAARQVFERGIKNCVTDGKPNIHLLQAWATIEMRANQTEVATKLFEDALRVDTSNPYVCHSYGLMKYNRGEIEKARELWLLPLQRGRESAALICSLGELETSHGNFGKYIGKSLT